MYIFDLFWPPNEDSTSIFEGSYIVKPLGEKDDAWRYPMFFTWQIEFCLLLRSSDECHDANAAHLEDLGNQMYWYQLQFLGWSSLAGSHNPCVFKVWCGFLTYFYTRICWNNLLRMLKVTLRIHGFHVINALSGHLLLPRVLKISSGEARSNTHKKKNNVTHPKKNVKLWYPVVKYGRIYFFRNDTHSPTASTKELRWIDPQWPWWGKAIGHIDPLLFTPFQNNKKTSYQNLAST